MINAREIIDSANKLPAELRIKIIEELLQSLNNIDPGIEKKWAELAENRLDDLNKGRAGTIPGDDVLKSMADRI